MDEELRLRLVNLEDGFTERKSEGAANAAEIRKTLVAFANSVPSGTSAIFFIGVENDGTVSGVTNADSIQKKIREVAKDCYPKVKYQVRVFAQDDKQIVATIVELSEERPHFSGPAFVREGSSSVAATTQIYDELIASRNTKAGIVLRNKGKLVTFRQIDLDPWGRHKPRYEIECAIKGADAHVVDLYDDASGRSFSVPLENVRINKDHTKNRMMLEVVGE